MAAPKKKKATNASRNRFIFGGPLSFFEPINAAEKDAGIISGPFSAFRENLQSAILVGSIPFQLVQSSVLQQRFNQLHTAARIRSLKGDGSKREPEAEKAAYQIARDEMDKELQDKTVINRHAGNTLSTLDSHLRNIDFSTSADELLRQVIVMAWGAFETLVNDGLRVSINSDPTKILKIAVDKNYKDALFGKSIIDELDKRGFNLSNCMGDLFIDAVRIDNLEKIHDVCAKLFSAPELNKALKDKELWKLSQRRHLIVHRRGIVDNRYLGKTGDKRVLGARLALTADEVEAALTIVRDTGITFTRVAAA
ncbi:hypothetical protein [Phyllobacterium phragmitis]|uniref:RiboL-PSP-HEPN domain-containing protein n=1 Tax=Phyllobacterium phragmitis TaxID=2670329 RepID=A0ABQ0GYI5_9HYPH